MIITKYWLIDLWIRPNSNRYSTIFVYFPHKALRLVVQVNDNAAALLITPAQRVRNQSVY